MSIDDRPRSWCPSTSRKDDNVAKINSLIREDRRQAIDKLCELSGVSWSSIKRILSDESQMRRVAAKLVPSLLTDDQNNRRIQACQELQDQLKDDPDFFDAERGSPVTFFIS